MYGKGEERRRGEFRTGNLTTRCGQGVPWRERDGPKERKRVITLRIVGRGSGLTVEGSLSKVKIRTGGDITVGVRHTTRTSVSVSNKLVICLLTR